MTINENMITELPICIGHLRNLKTLIADCNKIERLPESICSCNRLRILSLAENNLKYLPDDIGRLSSLQVLNLCNNYLTYLPFSLTQITNLKSIWLSENQTKPLMPFHSEFLEDSTKKILTCFLLPQFKNEEHTTTASDYHSTSNSQRRKLSFLAVTIDKPLITSNVDKKDWLQSQNNSSGDESDNPATKLLRQPTPYPKDLKVQARHARNLVLKHLDLNNVYVDEIKANEAV